MRVDVFLHGVLVRVGYRDDVLAYDEPHPVDGVYLGHVDDERAVYAQEFGGGEEVFQSLHVHKAHDGFLISLHYYLHILLHSLHIEDIVEVHSL